MPNLIDAWKYMEKHGMAKGIAEDENGSVCAVGAMAAVSFTDFYLIDDVAEELFPDRLAQPNIAGLRPVAQVNDHPDTTPDDMRVIFEKTQLRLDERV